MHNPYTSKIKKIYGVYFDKKYQRYRVQVHFKCGKRRTLNYGRFLMEIFYGRELHSDEETVDHIDGNKLNDFITNLCLQTRSENSKKLNVKRK